MSDKGTVVTISKDTALTLPDATVQAVAVDTGVRVRERENGEYLVCVDPSLAFGADKRIVKTDEKSAEIVAKMVLTQMEMEKKISVAEPVTPKSVEIFEEFATLGEQLIVEAQEEVKDAGIKQGDVDAIKAHWAEVVAGYKAILDKGGELDVEPATLRVI